MALHYARSRHVVGSDVAAVDQCDDDGNSHNGENEEAIGSEEELRGCLFLFCVLIAKGKETMS
jgi:hypothetical protein